MSNQRFTPEFKDEAVRQVVERGYSVAEVADRVGLSAHSLYKWVKAVRPIGASSVTKNSSKRRATF
jgi:transposase